MIDSRQTQAIDANVRLQSDNFIQYMYNRHLSCADIFREGLENKVFLETDDGPWHFVFINPIEKQGADSVPESSSSAQIGAGSAPIEPDRQVFDHSGNDNCHNKISGGLEVRPDCKR